MNRWLVVLTFVFALNADAVEQRWREGTARAFPVVLSPDFSERRGEIDYTQTVSGSIVTVKLRYYLNDGRRVSEEMTFSQGKQLSQRTWWFREARGDQVLREFSADLRKGTATARVFEKGKYKSWEKSFDPEPGKLFVGGGFSLALKNLTREVKTGPVELKALAFMPRPRVAKVKVTLEGEEKVSVAGRDVNAMRLVIRPEIPRIAKLFVKVPDNELWFTTAEPTAFLRSRSPMVSPSDPLSVIAFSPPSVPRAPVGRRRP